MPNRMGSRPTYPVTRPDEDYSFFRGGVLVTPARTVLVHEDELTDEDLDALPPELRASALAERRYLDEQEEREAARWDGVISDWRGAA